MKHSLPTPEAEMLARMLAAQRDIDRAQGVMAALAAEATAANVEVYVPLKLAAAAVGRSHERIRQLVTLGEVRSRPVDGCRGRLVDLVGVVLRIATSKNLDQGA